MSTGKILGGILVGVGAIAAAPFTGGGSLFAAGVSLSAALGGTAAAVGATVGAGVVGGVTGAIIAEDEKEKKKKENNNHFKEGVKAGSIKTKEKFYTILKTQKERDMLMLISIKIGVFVSKVDGVIDLKELEEINKLCLLIEQNPTTPDFIKNKVNEILNSNITYNEISKDVKRFLENKDNDYQKQTNIFFFKLIETIVLADGHKHPKEIEFMNIWKKEFLN